MKSRNRRPAVDIYIPESRALATTDQKRLLRLGHRKPETRVMLRAGMRGPKAPERGVS